MSNYFRITAYHKEKGFTIIMDCNGMFDKLWKFSSDLVSKGFSIIEASRDDNFLDGNIERIEPPRKKFILRAYMMGEPKSTTYTDAGIRYKAIEVDGHIYIPDKTQTA